MIPNWLLISGDFVSTGGMDGALLGLARYLAQREPIEVIAHRIAPELQSLPGLAFRPVLRPAGKHLLGAPLLAWQGRRRLQQLRPQGTRIICNGGNCPGSDINWVHYVHGAYQPRSQLSGWRKAKQALLGRVNRWTERQVLRQSQVVVCNSQRTAQDVIEQVGVSPDRVRVVYYGCDPNRLPPISPAEREAARLELDAANVNRPWLLFIGAMGDSRKGFDTLYAAWESLCASPAWDGLLWVVGSGAERPIWEARAQATGLADRIRFLGFRQDVPRILAACDLLVHPARYEAYGLGVQEALCRGLPAVVSRSAGVAERFPDALQTLLLNQPDHVAELVDRLTAWRDQLEQWPQRVAQLAAELRARTWDIMATEFVQAAGGARP